MGFRLLARGRQRESRSETTERFASVDRETINTANVHVAKDSVLVSLLHLLQSTSDSILHTNPTRLSISTPRKPPLSDPLRRQKITSGTRKWTLYSSTHQWPNQDRPGRRLWPSKGRPTMHSGLRRPTQWSCSHCRRSRRPTSCPLLPPRTTCKPSSTS